MKLIPLNDKVVVKREKTDEKIGHIILPDSAQEKPKQGKIVSVGRGRVLDNGTLREPTVKKGDVVLFGAYAGTEVKVDGKEYIILSEDEILSVLED